jgi:hypothetical protein
MKKLSSFLLVPVFALAMLGSCGGSKGASATTPYNELNKTAKDLREKGHVAVVGQGQSSREDIARQKAQNNGRQQLALALESKIQVLLKSLSEELGYDKFTNTYGEFSIMHRTIVYTNLRNVFPAEERILSKDGLFTVYVLMVVDSDTLNRFFTDEDYRRSKRKKLPYRWESDELEEAFESK